MIDLKVGDRVMLLRFKWGRWKHVYNATVEEVIFQGRSGV